MSATWPASRRVTENRLSRSQVVHLFLRPLVDRDVDLPGLLHLFHAEFRRLRRLLQQVARHQVDLGVAEVARGAPVRHAGRRAVGDEGAQVLVAELDGDVRGQRLAGRALAQDAVTPGAALEIDLFRALEVGTRQRRHRGLLARFLDRLVSQHVESRFVTLARFGLVFLEIGRARLLLSRDARARAKHQCHREQHGTQRGNHSCHDGLRVSRSKREQTMERAAEIALT